MHWVEHCGLRVPRRIAGHQALDFCNTWAGWGEPPDPRQEWLPGYANLVVWAHYAELLDTDESTRLRRRDGSGAATAALADARRLRSLLHRSVLDPSDRRALAGLTGYVRRAAGTVRLRPGAGPRWEVTAANGVELPLLRIAWAAGQLLTSGRVNEVRVCPGGECGWLFLDVSGRRRWCSMNSCGNRAKARAYAARHR